MFLNDDLFKFVMTKNILDTNKLVKYQLKSDFSRNVHIPLKYAYSAEKLIDIVLESESIKEVQNKASVWSSLNKVYIPGKLKELMEYYYNSKSYIDESKLLDQAYLETCLHLAYDDLSKNNVGDENCKGMEGGLERVQKIKNAENIKGVLESL